MIRAIDVSTSQYCFYEGFGNWVLNQNVNEPEPKSKVKACTWYNSSGDNGETGIIIYNPIYGNRISIDGHVVMNEAFKPITKSVDLIDKDAISEVRLRLKGNSRFTLEILNTTTEPPISKKIIVERFSHPELENLNQWPEIDDIIRRVTGQQK